MQRGAGMWKVPQRARRSSPIHLPVPKFCLGEALAPGEERKLFAKLLFDPTTLPSSRILGPGYLIGK